MKRRFSATASARHLASIADSSACVRTGALSERLRSGLGSGECELEREREREREREHEVERDRERARERALEDPPLWRKKPLDSRESTAAAAAAPIKLLGAAWLSSQAADHARIAPVTPSTSASPCRRPPDTGGAPDAANIGKFGQFAALDSQLRAIDSFPIHNFELLTSSLYTTSKDSNYNFEGTRVRAVYSVRLLVRVPPWWVGTRRSCVGGVARAAALASVPLGTTRVFSNYNFGGSRVRAVYSVRLLA